MDLIAAVDPALGIGGIGFVKRIDRPRETAVKTPVRNAPVTAESRIARALRDPRPVRSR
jgi:hypothetical protein